MVGLGLLLHKNPCGGDRRDFEVLTQCYLAGSDTDGARCAKLRILPGNSDLLAPGCVAEKTILEEHRLVSEFRWNPAAGFQAFEIIGQVHGVRGICVLFVSDTLQYITGISGIF